MIIKGISKEKSDPVSVEQKEIREEKEKILSKRRKVFIKKINPVEKVSHGKEKEKDLRDKLIARMLVMGFEPFEIAKTLRLGSHELRRRIREDEDFRQVIRGLEDELFGAIENKQKFLMKEALDKLSDLLKLPNPEINLECIDRVFRIHGKYVERTEDLTPPERKMTPEIAERILEKGIEYLKLTKEPKLIEGEKIISIE